MPKPKGDSPTANDPADDPDRWAWPHSAVMNSAEIDTFTARLARFTDRGLGLDGAEALADKLVSRDRDLDDRQLCLECIYLAGQSDIALRCKNWKRAGIALSAKNAQLATALVVQLQRCDGFSLALPECVGTWSDRAGTGGMQVGPMAAGKRNKTFNFI